MSETIINRNQLRAEGDTSSKTLISLSQIRQEGDTSPETLINQNQIRRAPQLNAEIVGNPTISDDFIVSGFSGTKYVYTTISDLSTSDDWELQIKFKQDGSSTTTRILLCFQDKGQIGWSSARRWWIWFSGIDTGMSYGYGNYGTWYWFRVIFSNGKISVKASTTGAFNGEESTLFSATNVPNYTGVTNILFGSSGGEYLNGAIDMKDCWFKINGSFVWMGVQ